MTVIQSYSKREGDPAALLEVLTASTSADTILTPNCKCVSQIDKKRAIRIAHDEQDPNPQGAHERTNALSQLIVNQSSRVHDIHNHGHDMRITSAADKVTMELTSPERSC